MGDPSTEFDQFAADVGDQIANKIRNRWGGLPLYIPRNMAPDHPIALTVGFDTAKYLVEEFGGVWIDYVPKREKPERDKAMRARRKKGQTIEDIALEFGCSKRLAQQVCEGVKPQR